MESTKPISDTKGKDRDALVSIVKEMTESMTGAQSTRHWAEGRLVVRHSALCLAGCSACTEIL